MKTCPLSGQLPLVTGRATPRAQRALGVVRILHRGPALCMWAASQVTPCTVRVGRTLISAHWPVSIQNSFSILFWFKIKFKLQKFIYLCSKLQKW
jgi:hypothetical protein